jgi:hypothetical protein
MRISIIQPMIFQEKFPKINANSHYSTNEISGEKFPKINANSHYSTNEILEEKFLLKKIIKIEKYTISYFIKKIYSFRRKE